MLQSTVTLRAQSVLGQLGGSIPSTDSAQRENADALISADGIDLSVMGQMNAGSPGGEGGGFPGFGGGFAGNFLPGAEGGQDGSAPVSPSDRTRPAHPASDAAGGGFDKDGVSAPSSGAAAFWADAVSGEVEASAGDDSGSSASAGVLPGTAGESSESGDNGGFSPPKGLPGGQGAAPDGQGGFPGAPGSGSGGDALSENLIRLGVSAAVMLASLVFVLLYRRRPRKR